MAKTEVATVPNSVVDRIGEQLQLFIAQTEGSYESILEAKLAANSVDELFADGSGVVKSDQLLGKCFFVDAVTFHKSDEKFSARFGTFVAITCHDNHDEQFVFVTGADDIVVSMQVSRQKDFLPIAKPLTLYSVPTPNGEALKLRSAKESDFFYSVTPEAF